MQMRRPHEHFNSSTVQVSIQTFRSYTNSWNLIQLLPQRYSLSDSANGYVQSSNSMALQNIIKVHVCAWSWQEECASSLNSEYESGQTLNVVNYASLQAFQKAWFPEHCWVSIDPQSVSCQRPLNRARAVVVQTPIWNTSTHDSLFQLARLGNLPAAVVR